MACSKFSGWVRAVAAGVLGGAIGVAAHAQGAPIKLLVGFPAGGGTDAIARILAEHLKQPLGAPVVVENKAGAGGQLAAQALKAAAPDGHTLFVSHDHTITIIPLTVKNPGYDTHADFVPVAGFATFVNGLALSGGTPGASLPDYVKWVQTQQGGKDTVGVPAPASVPEFLVKVLGKKYGVDLASAPYRGSAPMMADMLGNQIHAGVGSVPDFIEQHKAGKLRMVAVIGKARQPALPQVPTLSELGLGGFEDEPFYGLWAPKGTPAATLDKLAQALAQAVAQPQVKERLTAMGLNVAFMTGAQLAQREAAYGQTWARVIKESGFAAR